jgi:hypothetical protein
MLSKKINSSVTTTLIYQQKSKYNEKNKFYFSGFDFMKSLTGTVAG